MTHLGDDLLATYSLDPSAVPDREAVELHLRVCEECRAALAPYTSIDDALRHGETWNHAETVRQPPPRLSEFLQERRRMADEEADARRVLRPLLSSPVRFRHADLAKQRRRWTAGMVRVLCEEAHARHERQTKFSGQLATVAYNIALKLPDALEASKRALMGLALRERANALRYLGRFTEALKTLDAAEKLFDDSAPSGPFDLAVVAYIRATVYIKSEQLEEAVKAGRSAAAVFHDYGDQPRELAATMAAASALMLTGRYQEAADAYAEVVPLARGQQDLRMLASAIQNAGLVHVELGRLDEAEAAFTEALVLYDELDCPTEKARTTWARASVVVARGDLSEGKAQLDASRHELAHLGLTNDAALATLEWAEVCLALGAPQGVADACREVVMTFASEGLQRKAQEALATLNEALAAGKAAPKLLRHVRLYLETLPAHPDQSFAQFQ